jgi:hypothetical protein
MLTCQCQVKGSRFACQTRIWHRVNLWVPGKYFMQAGCQLHVNLDKSFTHQCHVKFICLRFGATVISSSHKFKWFCLKAYYYTWYIQKAVASGLRRRPAAARLLGLWVRIALSEWMFISCECCVLSGRGLCVGLITPPGESPSVYVSLNVIRQN